MRHQQSFALPALPDHADTLTRHFLSQFMHEFQSLKDGEPHARIQAAISKTASKTGSAPEAVARCLVESGLRAARECFPDKFVAAVENGSAAPQWNISSVTPQQRELLRFWQRPAANGCRQARRCR